MLRLSVLLAIVLLGICVRSQTAAPFPPLVYSYEGQSAPGSLLTAISTAGEPYRSIENESAGSDTATNLIGAFPSTMTIGDTNTPVAATTQNIYSSGNPGEVLSSNTRAPYTKIGTVQTTFSTGTQGAQATGTSGSPRGAQIPSGTLLGSGLAVMGGIVVGAMIL
ncbi:uncharacterized protein JCM6883_000835 [Sporobolomyces salmoneus]|uniref:uncharacterized protein n=1 Tax=Sporobolomyces salmoneus TaxID=183962 RepID=UPI003182881C